MAMVVAMKIKDDDVKVVVYLCALQSPHIGPRDHVRGYALYRAMLNNLPELNPRLVYKVSHGLFHVYGQGIRSSYYDRSDGNKYDTKTLACKTPGASKEHYQDIILNEYVKLDGARVKNYLGFRALREFDFPFGEGTMTRGSYPAVVRPYTFMARGKEQSVLGDDGREIAQRKDSAIRSALITFFTLTDSSVAGYNPGESFSIGAARNSGYGRVTVLDKTEFPLSELDFGEAYTGDLKNLALTGIRGIGDHQKYGYGEFLLYKTRAGAMYANLITPYSDSRGALPSFLEPPPLVRTCTEHMWYKGAMVSFVCVADGQSFIISRREVDAA